MLVTHPPPYQLLFLGDIIRYSQMETLFLQGKPSAAQLLNYAAALYPKILSLTAKQHLHPKVSFRPCLNTETKSFGFELLCFVFCRWRKLFKLQIQMADENVNAIKYTALLLLRSNLCTNFDAKKKKTKQNNRYLKKYLEGLNLIILLPNMFWTVITSAKVLWEK